MGTITAVVNLTLDGVMQAPGQADEDFYGFWPHQTDSPYTEVLDKTEKFVASRTLREPLPWQNSTLLAGDAVAAGQKLRADSVTTTTGVIIATYRPAGEESL